MCHAQPHSVWIKRVSKCFVIPVIGSGERRVVFVVKASAAARESQRWLAVTIAIAVQASRQSKWKDRAHWFPPREDIVAFVVSSVWLFDCMRILCLARSSSSPASLADSAMRPECAPILSLADSTAGLR